jgi:hypothetical protein
MFFGNPFWNYWALTLAVFFIYVFSFAVASMDVRQEIADAVAKAQAKKSRPRPRFENPQAGVSVAETFRQPANLALPPHLQWVLDLARPIADRLGVKGALHVYEDSKGHPLVHVNDGARMISYRLEKSVAQDAIAGDAAKAAEAQKRLEQFLRLEWLGDETAMRRVTELNKDAKPAEKSAARVEPAAPAVKPAPAPAPSPVSAPPAAPSAAPPAPSAPPIAPAADAPQLGPAGAASKPSPAASTPEEKAAERARIIAEAKARAAARKSGS